MWPNAISRQEAQAGNCTRLNQATVPDAISRPRLAEEVQTWPDAKACHGGSGGQLYRSVARRNKQAKEAQAGSCTGRKKQAKEAQAGNCTGSNNQAKEVQAGNCTGMWPHAKSRPRGPGRQLYRNVVRRNKEAKEAQATIPELTGGRAARWQRFHKLGLELRVTNPCFRKRRKFKVSGIYRREVLGFKGQGGDARSGNFEPNAFVRMPFALRYCVSSSQDSRANLLSRMVPAFQTHREILEHSSSGGIRWQTNSQGRSR